MYAGEDELSLYRKAALGVGRMAHFAAQDQRLAAQFAACHHRLGH